MSIFEEYVAVNHSSRYLDKYILTGSPRKHALGHLPRLGESQRLLILLCIPLSRLRLSRITAYLEVKIWTLFKHENLTTENKVL